MTGSSSPNAAFVTGTVGGDDDVWGSDVINANWNTMDGLLTSWSYDTDWNGNNITDVNLIRPQTTPYAAGNITGAVTLDAANGALQTATVTGNISSVTLSNLDDGGTLTLVATQDGTGGRTITYSTSTYKTVGGVTFQLTSTAGATDLLHFIKNGSVIYLLTNADMG